MIPEIRMNKSPEIKTHANMQACATRKNQDDAGDDILVARL
jgi:hypothetical protein